jgi:CRP-like cAMP-binding protein
MKPAIFHPQQLKLFSIVANLRITEADVYGSHVRKVQVRKGSYIYSGPQSPPMIYRVVSGLVKLGVHTDTGGETMHDFIDQGDLFGALALGDPPCGEYALAALDTEVYAIDADTFFALISPEPLVLQWVNSMLRWRLMRRERRLVLITTSDIRNRVVQFLEDCRMQLGRKEQEVEAVNNVFTLQDIAGYTGATRQTVSVVLSQLVEEGLIHYNRNRIVFRPGFSSASVQAFSASSPAA